MKDLVSQGPSAAAGSQAAEEETITTLRRLDAEHNRTVVQFLQEGHLIGAQDPVIDLSNADLSNDHLSGAPLNDINLTNADLSHANLAGANLSGSIMYSANLTGANLSGATLAGASLSSAILTGTDLSGADLSSADLPGADITQSQLDVARSCTDATLPEGVTCQPICRFMPVSGVLTCQQSPPIQLTYWYTESGAEAQETLKLVGEFNQQHRDIHVKAVPEDFFHALTAFTTAVQDGKAPDVFRSDMAWTPLFASKGYLLNIEPYVSQSDLPDYLSAALVHDECKGDLYGLPQGIDFPELLYNRNELNKAGITRPPATMEQFKQDAVQVVQNKKRDKATYGFEFGGTTYYALPFLYAYGGGTFGQHDNILVNNTGSVAGLNFLVNLQKMHVMPQEPSSGPPSGTAAVSDFTDGKTAMIFDGPHDIEGFLTGSHSAFNGNPNNLGIAPIPMGPAGQTGSPLGGESYVISAGTAHPAQAYEFIKFMSQTSSQVAIAKVNSTLPTRKSAYRALTSNNPFISIFPSAPAYWDLDSGSPFISVFLSALDKGTAVGPPPIPQTAYMFDAADPHIWDALNLNRHQSADEALKLIAYAWHQLGAGNLISQSTSMPGTSPAAC